MLREYLQSAVHLPAGRPDVSEAGDGGGGGPGRLTLPPELAVQLRLGRHAVRHNQQSHHRPSLHRSGVPVGAPQVEPARRRVHLLPVAVVELKVPQLGVQPALLFLPAPGLPSVALALLRPVTPRQVGQLPRQTL